MPLFADLIRLRQPRGHLVVDLGRIFEPENVYLVARRDHVDATKARTVEAACQHDVAVDPTTPQRESGVAHAHLEGDPRLLGQHFDGSGPPGHGAQLLEDGHHLRLLALEVLVKADVAAEMKLIPVGEPATTHRARPQRVHAAQLTISLP